MAAAQYYEAVQEAYLAYYGRPADPAGLAYWAAQLDAANGNMNAIINAFGNSAESTALYGGSSVAAQVNAIYETLFGRQADLAGLNYYVNGINNGTFSLASVALNIYNGAQGSDATELAAKLAYAEAFTTSVTESVAAQVAYVGTTAANTARAAVAGVVDANSEASAVTNLPGTMTTIIDGPTITLTAGADNVTGANIVGSLTPYSVDGVGPTLNYNDVITGLSGSTNNTLTLNDDYASGNDVIPLGATISNIQNIVLQTQGNAGSGIFNDGGSAFDTSGIAGVLNLTVTSAGGGEDFVQAAGTTAVNVTHQSSEGSVAVYGGSNVTVTSNGGGEGNGVQIGSTTVANVDPTGAVTVTETGSTAQVYVFGGTTVNVSDSGAYGSIEVGAVGAVASPAEPTGAVTVDSTGVGTSVDVFGGTNVTVNTVGSGYESNVDVTIGAIGPNEQVYAPTGNVTVSVNEATAYQYDSATSVVTGYESDVSILGGADISVTTNAGNVTIGGDALNVSTLIAGQNPTGSVSVTDTSDLGSVEVYGGTTVTVNSVGDVAACGPAVVIGAIAENGQVVAPTGNVTVNVNEATAYEYDYTTDLASGFESDVAILGGASVTVTTNAGDVIIGGDVPNAADTGALAGQDPSGNVKVTDTSDLGNVYVYGGANVTVNASGGYVQVGAFDYNEGNSYVTTPTGSVTITDTSPLTGSADGGVRVLGGTDISVTTNVGDVKIGTHSGFAGTEPTGTVHVTDTSGGNVGVYGGTDVTVTTSGGFVQVGAVDYHEGDLVSAPSGTITVTDTAPVDDTQPGGVEVVGGTDVSVTTNVGDVKVGTYSGIAGTEPTGTVDVTDTAAGSVEVFGGTDVTVNASGSSDAVCGDVTIGSLSNGQLFTPTGNVSVTVNEAAAYEYDVTTDSTSGYESDIAILGGVNVTVTTNAGNVTIGGDAPNGSDTAALAGQNPTGTVNVTDTSDLGNVAVYGGTDVTVNAAGGFVQVGGFDYNEGDSYVTAPTGTVTVTDTAPAADGVPGGVVVIGGTDVTVTTDVGGVKVGTYSGITGSEPTGTVNVTDTADGRVVVEGGTDVTVNAAGGAVRIGTGNATTDPSGNVSVTQSAIETGGWGEYKYRSSVDVAGGVNVTVNTTGGDVRVGTAATAVTGAVSINDTFVGSNVDSFHVDGGTTVSITTTATSGDITVGGPNPADNLDSAGTGLANAADYATGNVTIVDESVAGTSAAGSSNVYGTGNVTVNTNGATSVSITGGSSVSVTDVETTAATGGSNIGQAIGTSTLATVSLDGVSGCATLTSDALNSLTIADSARGAATDVTVINTVAQALTLTLDNDAWGTSVTDATATTVTIDTTGVDASHLVLDADYATSLTFDNAAAVTLDGADSSINDVVLITASGSGALALGDLSCDTGLALVDASTASGTVSVTLDPNSTSFLGGSGNDTVTLDSAATGVHTITGGSGDNTLVVNYDGSGEGALLGGNITNFQTLDIGRDGSGTFNVTGFTSLEVGHDGGAVTFTDVAAGTGLDITASPADTITYDVVNPTPTTALSVTLGTDNTSSTWSAPVTATVIATGLNDIDIDSEGFAAAGTNQLTIGDSDAQTITITGDRSVSVTLDTDSGDAQTSTYEGSDVTTINASGSTGAVNLTGVALALSGATITGGAGVLTAHGVEVPASLDAKQVETVTVFHGVNNNSVSITIDGHTYTQAISNSESAATVAQDLVDQIGTVDGVTATLVGPGSGSGLLQTYEIALTADTAGIGFTSSVSGTLLGWITETTTTANGNEAAQLGSQAVDSITTGSGGGVITIGQGGSWVEGSGASGIYGVGSETVNLSASTNVVDTIIVNDGAVSTFNGVAGGITGFQITANASTSDELTFGTAKTVLANVVAPTHVSGLMDFNAAVAVLDPTGALKTALANLAYTVSNGVITFSATGGHPLSDFTVAQLISAAEIIVNSDASQVATFSAGGNTYVVTDDAGATLATGGGGNLDSITELIGVTGVQGFGSTAAANTIVATNVTNDQIANSSNTGADGAFIYDETGFSHAALGGLGQAAGSVSTVLNNLAASAQLDISAAGDLGQVSTTQVGASGSNSLTLNFNGTDNATLDTLTVTGDNALVIHANGTGEGATQQTITSLVDATNTVTTITVDGTNALTINGISDTALTTFNASGLTGDLNLTANQNGLTINGGLGGDNLNANGNGDTITVGDATHWSVANVDIQANGLGDTITLHGGASSTNLITASSGGDVISVDQGANLIAGGFSGLSLTSALGTGDTINLASGGSDSVWVGSNSTVNIGSAHTALTGCADIQVTGDVTGTGSAGDYALTVININGASLPNAFGTLDLTFNNVSAESFAGGSAAASQVNVASATSLANALDIAATQAAVLDSQHGGSNTSLVNGVVAQNAGTGLVDYFQYGGNTYVVEAVNSSSAAAAHTGLGAGDVVIELSGQVNVGALGCFSGHQLQLTIGHAPV